MEAVGVAGCVCPGDRDRSGLFGDRRLVLAVGGWRLAYGCSGETESPGMVRAAGTVARDLLAFGKQIGIACIGQSASWRQPWWCALLDVVEDLANEVGVGDGLIASRSACDDPRLSATERAECDVYFKHTL